MAHDVFISYASADKTVAENVCRWLEARHIKCWMAPRDVKPGRNFAEAVLDAIDGASIFILIFSTGANESSHVMGELDRARTKKIPIVPFRIDTSSPSRTMQYYIAMYQWLDASTPPVKKHIPQLIEIVQEILVQQQKTAKAAEKPVVSEDKVALEDTHKKQERAGRSLHVKIIIPALVVILAFTGIYYFVIRPGNSGHPAQFGDTTAPVIGNVTATSIAEKSALITWSTDESATSSVEYGEDENFGESTPPGDMLTTAHSVSLTGLDPNTTYYYRVRSLDNSGNEVISETRQLNTLPPSKVWKLVFNNPLGEAGFTFDVYKSYAEMVETATKGQVEMVFNTNDPVPIPTAPAALKSGVVDIADIPCIHLSEQPYLFRVTGLPLLGFSSGESASLIAWELYEQNPDMQKELTGVHVLTTIVQPALLQTRKPVRTLDDIKGLKLGYPVSYDSSGADMLRMLGAEPEQKSSIELAQEAIGGSIDGTLVTWDSLCGLKLYESMPYILRDFSVTAMVSVLAINGDAWDSLPPDIQGKIDSVSGTIAAELCGRGLNEIAATKVPEITGESGIKLIENKIPQDELITCVEQYARPQWELWVEEMESQGLPGQKVIDEAIQLINEYSGEKAQEEGTQPETIGKTYIMPAAPSRQPPPEGATLIVQDGFDDPESGLWPVMQAPKYSLSYADGTYSIQLTSADIFGNAMPNPYKLELTDLLVEADIDMLDKNAYYGFRFETGGDYGTFHVAVDGSNEKYIWINEQVQGGAWEVRERLTVTQPVDFLRVIRSNGTLQVYINDTVKPVVECKLKYNIPVEAGMFAGNVNLSGQSGHVRFDNFRLYSIDQEQST